MVRRSLAAGMLLFFACTSLALSQDMDEQMAVDYKVEKMKKYLGLTDAQAQAVKPVIKNFIDSRLKILKDAADQGVVDHTPVKSALNALKEDEYNRLSKILTPQQLKKWEDKEILMATLNPDNVESTVEDGVGVSQNGVGMTF